MKIVKKICVFLFCHKSKSILKIEICQKFQMSFCETCDFLAQMPVHTERSFICWTDLVFPLLPHQIEDREEEKGESRRKKAEKQDLTRCTNRRSSRKSTQRWVGLLCRKKRKPLWREDQWSNGQSGAKCFLIGQRSNDKSFLIFILFCAKNQLILISNLKFFLRKLKIQLREIN